MCKALYMDHLIVEIRDLAYKLRNFLLSAASIYFSHKAVHALGRQKAAYGLYRKVYLSSFSIYRCLDSSSVAAVELIRFKLLHSFQRIDHFFETFLCVR